MADKFTKGPWEAEYIPACRLRGNDIDSWTISGEVVGKQMVVADTLNMGHLIDPEMAKANAKLLAAAPKLLDAARQMLQYLEVHGSHSIGQAKYAALLSAAIAAATE
jgi:hypothetical protein